MERTGEKIAIVKTNNSILIVSEISRRYIATIQSITGEVHRVNAEHLVECWNAFEEGGLVRKLVEACEKGTDWMTWIELRNKCVCEPNCKCVKCVITEDITMVEQALAKAKEVANGIQKITKEI